MSLAESTIIYTTHDDGSADFTLSMADDDHTFSVSQSGDVGIVSYEETLSWRGRIRVSEPDESIWRALMQSDEMTAYLEQSDLTSIRRERNP